MLLNILEILMSLSFGMNLLLWTTHVDESHISVLEGLKAAGYDSVELPLFEGDAQHYRKMSDIIKDIGLKCTTVTNGNPRAHVGSPDPVVYEKGVDHLKWALEMANILGSKMMGGPFMSSTGWFTGEGPSEALWDRSAKAVNQVASLDSSFNWAMEFLNRFEIDIFNTAHQCVQYLKRVEAPNVGIHYDTHHAHYEISDIMEEIVQAGSAIRHVHFSENHRGRLGTGLVDWNANSAALKEIDYSGSITCEMFDLTVPAIVQAARVHRNMVGDQMTAAIEALSFMKKTMLFS
jgi:D-psicose/D-tagatose/L-ribulose 3-epimerase